MAYIFHEDDLPKLVSVVPGRERTFFVNKELANIDDMLAGVMHYKQGASSPYHLHENCEHFYFIMEGKGTVETPEGVRDVVRATWCSFPRRPSTACARPRRRCFTSNSRRPIVSRRPYPRRHAGRSALESRGRARVGANLERPEPS